ncbi:uncharacterized protein [Periplaneta americana]|uniref:uncharacterized protein n=1 Tax=Periplaneta americana TaxID=6978 RepID=UPI0037E8555F
MQMESQPTCRLSEPKSKQRSRLDNWPDNKYNPGVLVGNWFEEQGRYLQPKLQHKTIYATDYVKAHPSLSLQHNFLADRIIENQGVGSELLIEECGTDYYNNFSTSYDLQYRYCPQELTGARPRIFNTRWKKYEPQQDYTLNYGNVTQFGLAELKRDCWSADLARVHKLSTEYREAYLPLSTDNLIAKRIAVPRKYSSALCEINLKNKHAMLRGKKISVVPDVPVHVPKKLSCGLRSGYALNSGCKK